MLLDGAEDSGGEVEEGGDELEDSTDDDAYQAERQQDEPDERVEDDGDERERPAGDEKDEEDEQFEHCVTPVHLYGIIYLLVPGIFDGSIGGGRLVGG